MNDLCVLRPDSFHSILESSAPFQSRKEQSFVRKSIGELEKLYGHRKYFN